MKRRFVAAMLAGVMACSLAGCNTKSPMAGKEETTTAADTQAGSDTQAALAEGETDKQAEAAGPITIQFWNAFRGRLWTAIIKRIPEELRLRWISCRPAA